MNPKREMRSSLKDKILTGLNPLHSPVFWVNSILVNLDIRLAPLVAAHLVAAALRKSHSRPAIDIRPILKEGHVESRHSRMITIGSLIYLVTTKPDMTAIRACKRSLSIEHKTILLVPKTKINRAVSLLKESKLRGRISVFSIEEFISTKIILLLVIKESNLSKFSKGFYASINNESKPRNQVRG
jgi:hypothetical protein